MPFELDTSVDGNSVNFADDRIIPFRQNTPAERILITGARGFLGSEIARQLDAAGLAVTALARQWPSEAIPSRHVTRGTGDITDAASIWPLFEGVTTVIHSAGLAHQFGRTATRADAFRQVNVQGTENVLRAAVAANVKHVVLVSSVSVYGGGADPTDESFPCKPIDPYGISKWQAEQVAREIAEATGIRLTILRMATIFGEGDPGNIGRLMQAIDRGRFIWLGTGANQKSLIYRGDAARACVLAAQSRIGSKLASPELARIYNVTLPAVRVARIVDALANGLGRPTPRWYIPSPLVKTIGGGLAACMARRGPVARMYRTISKWLSDDVYLGEKFERDYQFHPEVSVEEGLRRETEWFRHSKAA